MPPKFALFPILLALLLLAACASHTKDIRPQYTSPMVYRDYTCPQLAKEMADVTRRASEVGGVVDETASRDSAQMGIGLLLLWPTLFFLDGDTPQAAEYARLTGERDALMQAMVKKNCKMK